MYKLNSKLPFQIFLMAGIILFSFSCKKESTNDETTAQVNTWTFTEGSQTFNGNLLFDANLTTDISSNNAYTFGILGFENTSGDVFNVVMSLLDTTFTVKSYQSGIDGNEYLNAFHYGPAASADDVYKSSNLDPGAVMTYTITSYDVAKDIVTITFSGKAQIDDNGTMKDITKGRITAHISR